MSFEVGVVEVIKWIRESVRPVVVSLLMSALALFLPHSWLTAIGIADWLQKYRVLLILLFAGSVIWLGTFPIEGLYRTSQRKRRLRSLAPDEQTALRPYIQNRKTIHYFGWTNLAIAKNLETLGLLSYTGVADGGGNHAYSVNPWTFSYLSKHPKFVGLTKNSN